MENDFLNQFGVTVAHGRFYLAHLKRFSDGLSVFQPEIFQFGSASEVTEFVNRIDCFARLAIDTGDAHLFEILFKNRKHQIRVNWVFESSTVLTKRICLEGRSDLDGLPNLKSSLVHLFQTALGDCLAVPEVLLSHMTKVTFENDEFGNLRPYWPRKVLSPEFKAMLSAIYPFSFLRFDGSSETMESAPRLLLTLARLGLKERSEKISTMRSAVEEIKGQVSINRIF